MKIGFAILLAALLAGCAKRPRPVARASAPSLEQFSCPAGTEDMLRWFTPRDTSKHVEGNHNPLYTAILPDRFYWTKSRKGWPWDIQLYDSQYIYLWITENGWSSPQSFKKFMGKNLPLSPRCVALNGGKNASITVPDTRYQQHTSCSQYTVKNLRRGINEVWGPYPVEWPAIGEIVPTLVVSYRYNCDENYGSCRDKETYSLVKDYGLMEWRHYHLVSPPDGYEVVEVTKFDRLEDGNIEPYFPCR